MLRNRPIERFCSSSPPAEPARPSKTGSTVSVSQERQKSSSPRKSAFVERAVLRLVRREECVRRTEKGSRPGFFVSPTRCWISDVRRQESFVRHEKAILGTTPTSLEKARAPSGTAKRFRCVRDESAAPHPEVEGVHSGPNPQASGDARVASPSTRDAEATLRKYVEPVTLLQIMAILQSAVVQMEGYAELWRRRYFDLLLLYCQRCGYRVPLPHLGEEQQYLELIRSRKKLQERSRMVQPKTTHSAPVTCASAECHSSLPEETCKEGFIGSTSLPILHHRRDADKSSVFPPLRFRIACERQCPHVPKLRFGPKRQQEGGSRLKASPSDVGALGLPTHFIPSVVICSGRRSRLVEQDRNSSENAPEDDVLCSSGQKEKTHNNAVALGQTTYGTTKWKHQETQYSESIACQISGTPSCTSGPQHTPRRPIIRRAAVKTPPSTPAVLEFARSFADFSAPQKPTNGQQPVASTPCRSLVAPGDHPETGYSTRRSEPESSTDAAVTPPADVDVRITDHRREQPLFPPPLSSEEEEGDISLCARSSSDPQKFVTIEMLMSTKDFDPSLIRTLKRHCNTLEKLRQSVAKDLSQHTSVQGPGREKTCGPSANSSSPGSLSILSKRQRERAPVFIGDTMHLFDEDVLAINTKVILRQSNEVSRIAKHVEELGEKK